MVEGSGIEVTAKHNPLAWLLYFTKLTVTVDGQPERLSWGTHVMQAEPGLHRLEISFGYLGRQRGAAAADVTVPESGAVKVQYKMPSWMFAAGRLTVV
jgi:hypothetical protein